MSAIPQRARSRPKAPPITDNKTLSVSNWRAIRQRLAPTAVRIAISFLRAVEKHQPLRFMVRQRADEHRIHDAENCGVRANTERQRNNHDNRDAGVLQQHSRAVTQVLPEC